MVALLRCCCVVALLLRCWCCCVVFVVLTRVSACVCAHVRVSTCPFDRDNLWHSEGAALALLVAAKASLIAAVAVAEMNGQGEQRSDVK